MQVAMNAQPADIIRLTPYGIAMKALTEICDAHEPGTAAHDTAQAALDEAFRRTGEITAAKIAAPGRKPEMSLVAQLRAAVEDHEPATWDKQWYVDDHFIDCDADEFWAVIAAAAPS